MKILWTGFAARNHSWSIVAQNICRQLVKMGHDVDIISTNGNSFFPEDLLPNLKGFVPDSADPGKVLTSELMKDLYGKLSSKYDMQLSYTALKNFCSYFQKGDKNRFGIWNYETTIIPKTFTKQYKCVDQVLPSSEFSKNIFTSNGMPAEAQTVIHHGINPEDFVLQDRYPLRTKKKIKFLANIAQPHLRKNVPGLLKAWGKAFVKQDDVCLILKISKKSPHNTGIDIDVNDVLKHFSKTFKGHAEIEIIDTFIPKIESLYNACDVVFTMSHAECFWMPGLEGFAANKIVVAPNYGGQLDYMNKDNSFLISGKEIRADLRMQYWEPSPYAKVFDPDVDHAASILKEISKNYDDYHKSFSPKMQELIPTFTWNAVTQKIVDLCK